MGWSFLLSMTAPCAWNLDQSRTCCMVMSVSSCEPNWSKHKGSQNRILASCRWRHGRIESNQIDLIVMFKLGVVAWLTFAMASPQIFLHDSYARATLHGTVTLSVHQSWALVYSTVGAGGQISVWHVSDVTMTRSVQKCACHDTTAWYHHGCVQRTFLKIETT